MSRRSVMIAAVRKNLTKHKLPVIIVIPDYTGTREPIVVWLLDRRAPTKEEIAEAVAQWKREQAAQATKQSNPKPTDTVAS